MRWALISALFTACYRPAADPSCRIECAGDVPGSCPAGMSCVAGLCQDETGCPDDARRVDADVDSAISMTDASLCIGTNDPLRICLGGMPTNDLNVTTSTTVDTGLCASPFVHQGVTLCVYAYRSVTISNTLQLIGPHPAVIVATDSVVIEDSGTLTAAEALTQQPGAGSDPMDCPSLAAGGNSQAENGGAGGGAGGSFASRGGAGGSGTNGLGASSTPAIPGPYLKLRGGCTGSRGGNQGGGTDGGIGGLGGGALAILSSSTIVVDGNVYAYGSGGGRATAPLAGGGGGGAGGMIVLDAPSIDGTGRINAAGGGGASGGSAGLGGMNGGTPITINMGDVGGSGAFADTGAGAGGQGGSTGNASVGGNGSSGGGGGGGGGGGVVLLRGTVQASLSNVYPRR